MLEDKSMEGKCPKCSHPYKCPAGWPRCLEIVPCAEEPGSTVCVCTDTFHGSLPEYKIPPGSESSFFVNTNKSKRAIRIDPTKPFEVRLDLAPFIKSFGADILCSKCDEVLVRIEPGGILGEELNELDAMVIRDHLAKHSP